MIKEIKIDNFFSFGEHTSVVLNDDFNILVGINASGKSNFIKAIHLLYQAIVGDGFEKLLNSNWGGFSSIANFGGNAEEVKISYEFDCIKLNEINNLGFRFQSNPIYEITIKKVGTTMYKLNECLYNVNPKMNQPFVYLKVENDQAFVSKREKIDIKLERIDSFNHNEFLLRQLSDPEFFFPLYTVKKAIEQISIYNYFDTTPKSVIRQLSSYYSETKLLQDGSNLTMLLNYINTNHAIDYDKIIAEIKNINPSFKELTFSSPIAGKTQLGLKEKNLHKTIPIENLSDGTIRFLILMSIFYNPQRGKLVCIDEPEIGLHPDMINTLAAGIKHASQSGTQLIIATHSPLLLNNFDIEDVLIFEKNKVNQTMTIRKTEDDFSELEGELLVGQLWLNGKLGGVRW
jgi:predicted ATPase